MHQYGSAVLDNLGLISHPRHRWDLRELAARHRGLLLKAGSRMRNIALVAAWNTWMDVVDDARDRQAKRNKYVCVTLLALYVL
jgi:hypothetical protein